MPTPQYGRLTCTGVLSGTLSGLFTALPAFVEIFTGETATTSFFLALAPALALPLLAAMHQRQSTVTGRFGETAYVINLIGLGLFGGAAFASNLVLFYFDDAVVKKTLTGPTVPALIGCAAVFAVGCALFGAATVRARVFPRVPSWAYATVPPQLAFLTALPESALTSALHIAVGATLIWLASALWQPARTAALRAEALAGGTGPG
ncbi:hypothetical protein [Streptomyces monomycini]|uniref:hypothetical protein n=1 Tax=Streptomyces monomycini TaxID=371720 RepID=UPI00067DBFFD|nr:hypothetical protein [Streptomyces monomycini]